MDEEGSQIPWDAFFYRGHITRYITKNGVTRVEKVRPPRLLGQPSGLVYEPNSEDFWEVELMALVEKHGAVIFQAPGAIRIWGDGIRLWLPYLWIHDTPDEDLVAHIITGIKVSLRNRHILGY